MRTRLLRAQAAQKRYADKRRREVEFAVGDKVLLSTRNIRLAVPSRKVADRYVGPFVIVERIGQVAYRLDLARSKLRGLHDVFHVSLLRPFRDNGLGAQPPPVLIEDDDVEWEVDAILAHRTHQG